MKRHFIFLHLLLIVLVSACRKDLGNYSYKEISGLQIGNINDNYLALAGQPFQVDPTLTFDKGKDFSEEDYTYEWTANDMASSLILPKVISKERKLAGDLTLPAASYRVFYRVTEKATGLFWQKDFRLEVTSEMAGGWLVLNEINNHGRLDMLNYSLTDKKFTYYRDILQTYGGLMPDGKPSFVYYLRNRDVFNSGISDRVYVGTDKLTYSFNVHKYTWDSYRNMKVEVIRPTGPDYHAVKILSTGAANVSYMLDSEGVVSLEYLAVNLLYGNSTLNRLSTGSKINISSIMAAGYGLSSPYLIMYDTDNRRFITHSGNSSVSLLSRANTPGAFNPADMKKDLLFIEYVLTAQKQYYALLKDPVSGQLSLLRFTALGAVFTPLSYDVIPLSQELEKASFYAVDPTQGYLIYAVDNKVYSYNPFNKTHALMADYGARKISMIKYQRIVRLNTDPRLLDYGKSLMICTYDPAVAEKSGKIEMFKVGLDGKLTLQTTYEGFEKIVDVSYRE